MIRLAREQNKLTITFATQMMEIDDFEPRAHARRGFPSGDAVLDGIHAVMLSAESASGKYPVETIAAMSRICEVAESSAE